MKINPRLGTLAFAGLLLLLASLFAPACSTCGYGFKGGALPAEAKTLKVDFFNNKAALVNPSLSQTFTERLKDKFLRETRLRLTTESNPDLHFSGIILNYTVTPQAVQNQGASLNRLTITVRVEYINALDKKANFKQDFTNFADFSATQSLSAVEATLIDDICNKLVQDIFNKAVIDW